MHGGCLGVHRRGRHRECRFIKAGQAGFHRAQRLLQAFVDGAANGHGFAHGLHRGGQKWLGAREFLEGKARDLGDDIVDRRLEDGRRDPGDVVVSSSSV